MAREQRKDVDYFPHECTHGKKMHIIESKYGNDGYATWFKLLEQLGKANNHFIDISDEDTLMFLASVFRIDEEKTKLILTDLAKIGAIDKFLFTEHSIIFSQKFTDSVQDAYRKRINKIFQYSDVLSEKGIKTAQSTGRNPQTSALLPEVIPKEKDRIEKKRKVDEKQGFDTAVDSDFLNYKIKIVAASESVDLDEELAKLQQELYKSKNDDQRTFYSQRIDFVISQQKIRPPTKGCNKSFADDLNSDEVWLEDMVRVYKISLFQLKVKIQEFLDHLKTEFKEHPSKSEFVKHFKYWIVKSPSETKKVFNNNGQIPDHRKRKEF